MELKKNYQTLSKILIAALHKNLSKSLRDFLRALFSWIFSGTRLLQFWKKCPLLTSTYVGPPLPAPTPLTTRQFI